MKDHENTAAFAKLIMPNLDAAYNLARWITGDQTDAEDVVQESFLRALRSFDGFRGGDARSWILTIVRNTGYTWLKKGRGRGVEFDEHLHSQAEDDPESRLILEIDTRVLRDEFAELGVEFREVLVLREIEGMSYKEIARVTGLPIGTVMSRLARARQQLHRRFAERVSGGQT